MNTPTPWKLNKAIKMCIVDNNNRMIAYTGSYRGNIDSQKIDKENESNAELIVRAVNYHDTLVDMVKCLVDNIEFSNPDIQDKYVESWNNALMNAKHLLYLIKEDYGK